MLHEFSMQISWDESIFIETCQTATPQTNHDKNIPLLAKWLIAVILIKSELSSNSLFVSIQNDVLYIYKQSENISAYQHVCRADSNISSTRFKRSRERGEFFDHLST